MNLRLAQRIWHSRLRLVSGPVRFYQERLSVEFPSNCQFKPSCSHYMLDALAQFGLVKGVCAGLWRLVRCNPRSAGGYDPASEFTWFRSFRPRKNRPHNQPRG
ncbi:MAG: membrane protein insertion efficiency factor YidD [bacterium]